MKLGRHDAPRGTAAIKMPDPQITQINDEIGKL